MAKRKVVFKPYQQHQAMLLPPSLDEMVPADHLVRVVNEVIDKMELDSLLDKYLGGGTSSFHPRMMLKVWIYGYLSKVYSSRKLAKALRENVMFMWLSGMNQPDFRTLNDFRSKRMKEVIADVFKNIVLFCIEQNYIDLAEYFVDGTKMRADANKYKAVWKKNTYRYKEQVLQKVDELLQQIDRINEEENNHYGNKDLEETGDHTVNSSEELKQKIEVLTEQINDEQADKLKARELSKVKTQLKHKQTQLHRYEQQEKILDGRNSYSKTDPDAVMMRTKDDQLLPCYNIINGCRNQFIIHYSVGQNTNDATDFSKHFHTIPKELTPSAILGDSIFGSEKNYRLLENSQIDNYLMYQHFHAEQKKNYGEQIFQRDNFLYDAKKDVYICPNKQQLPLTWQGQRKLTDNTKTFEKRYEATGCDTCEFYDKCCKGRGNRTIRIRPELEVYKQKARSNLTSDKGKDMRKRRGVEVETPFADIKHNQEFRRLHLRGIEKVNIDIGLISIAHNLKKIHAQKKNAA